MFKRELKSNFLNFMIWTIVLLVLFLVVFLVYPSIVNSENGKMIDEMMEIFPKELLKAFNMDIASIDTAFGWLKTEGFVFVLLIIGLYSALLGSNILLKEESDKTIEYLHSLPVTRTKIVMSKVFCGLFYIISMTLILAVFNYIALVISGDFDKKQYILLSVTPIFSSIVIFGICLFLSTFTHKTKKTIGISFGIVLASYFLNVVSEMSESVEFLKYFSTFTLADIRNIIADININPVMVAISAALTVIFIALTLIRYKKKELV